MGIWEMGISMKQNQIFAFLIVLCFVTLPVEAQVFDIDTIIEDTPSLSLEVLSSPATYEKELWMNWTIRLTVVEWNPEWNTSDSWDHPSLAVAVKASTVDFTEHNNVSFSLNLGSEAQTSTSMSIIFIGYLYVGTTYNLGNLSHITSQDYNVSVKFASDMPTTAYTVEMRLYDPFATTTTTITSTTTSSTTTTTTTTGNSTPTVNPQFFIPIIVISLVTIFAIVAVLKSERLK